MSKDNLRNFTCRFLESEFRRVESTAKPFYGGRLSTGEAIRRLAAERLDEIESLGPRASMTEMLLRILGVWHAGRILELEDLRFLAVCANQAYRRCRLEFVSRELLLANVSAFRDAVQLSRGKSKGIEPEERYFLSNLRTSEDIQAKTLSEYVDRWIALLGDRPPPLQAELASRNLLTYLRDEEFRDESQLAKALSPHVPALLQVAIRGYWDMDHEPLIEQGRRSPTAGPVRVTGPASDGGIALRPVVQEHHLSAFIEVTGRECGVGIRNIVELDELVEVTRAARAGNDARGSTFEWSIQANEPKTFVLTTDRGWLRLNSSEFASLAKALDALFRDPSIVALVERLRYVYGRI